MSKQQSKYEKLLEQVVGFRRVYATISGSACGGLFLSQAKFWDMRTSDPEGWFYKTYADWERETALNRTELDKIRHHLENMKIIETWKKGKPAKLYYRVNNAKLDEFLDAVLDGTFQASRPKSPNPRKTRKIADGQQSSSLLTVNNSKFVDGQQTSVADGQQTSVADGQQTILYTKNTNIDYKTESTGTPLSQKSIDVQPQTITLTPEPELPVIQPVVLEPVTELKTTLSSSTITPSSQKETPVNSNSTALTHEGQSSSTAHGNDYQYNIDQKYTTKYDKGITLPKQEMLEWALVRIGSVVSVYRKSGKPFSASENDINVDFALFACKHNSKKGEPVTFQHGRNIIKKWERSPEEWDTLIMTVHDWQASVAAGKDINLSQKYQEAAQPETRLERIMRERREKQQAGAKQR